MEPDKKIKKDHWVIHPVKQAKRIIMIVIGFTILFFGILMIVLPGPATVVIPIGLAILATEFVWARKLLNSIKDKAKQVHESVMKKNSK